MIASDLQRWAAELETAIASDTEVDLEPLWGEISAAIENQPQNAELRRLRIRLAEASYQHTSRHADLQALRAIDPADRQVWLDLALLQHRWAFLLVNDDGDEAEAEGTATDDPTVAVTMRAIDPGSDAATPQAALEAEALQWLAALLAEQQHDANFCAQVFDRWTDASIYAPWFRLRLALQAAAAHPQDNALSRVLVAAWDDLANQTPELHDPEGPPPMGFLVDACGTLWDPFLLERAIRGYTELLARFPGDAELLRKRARMWEAACDFPAAAADFDAAARALEKTHPDTSDDDIQELRERAVQCAGGRAALQQAAIEALDAALKQLHVPFARREDASAAANDFITQWEANSRERVVNFDADLRTLREQQSAAATEADAEQLAQMRVLAKQVAHNVAGSVQRTPMPMDPIDPSAFESDWALALSDVRETLRALGWRELGWVEWPTYRAIVGHQVVSSVWSDPASGTLAVASAAHGTVLVDLETELNDGRLIASSNSRGRNFLTGGPQVDTLFIEPMLPLADACALHAARITWAVAQTPECAPRHCHNLSDAAAMQERGREAKVCYRLAEGLSRWEALGVPHDYPELLAPMMQQATRELLAELQTR